MGIFPSVYKGLSTFSHVFSDHVVQARGHRLFAAPGGQGTPPAAPLSVLGVKEAVRIVHPIIFLPADHDR